MTGQPVEDFALVTLRDEAVLLDLRTGVYLTLNDSARLVWEQHLAGADAASVATTLQSHFGISRAQAEANVRDTLDLQAVVAPSLPAGDLRYETTSSGYELLWQSQPVLAITPDGRNVRLLSPQTEPDLRFYLHGVVPKILALRGYAVMHASAVLDGAGVTVLSGYSGAGKTTTAQVFSSLGDPLVAVDKLVITVEGATTSAFVDGEARIAAWVGTAAATLRGRGDLQDDDLLEIPPDAPRLPITEVLFLAATRRRGDTIVRRPLRPGEAIAAFFESLFLGSAERSTWRDQLRLAHQLASHVTAHEATVPDGLEALRTAAADYRTKRTS